MSERPKGATVFLPESPARSRSKLAAAAETCRGCSLYARATRVVFGEGKAHAKIMLVGEGPGDREDIEGRPFVGPAGRVLREALTEAHLDVRSIYMTNAVKHFGWRPRGKRRIHEKPKYVQVVACRPWLDEELRIVRPTVIVCLGATAAHSFFGSSFKLTASFGKALSDAEGRAVVTTYHPSAILRMPDEESRKAAQNILVRHLSRAGVIADRQA